jgi:hypothetical protein
MGIAHLEFMQKNTTITGSSYAKTLANFRDAMHHNRRRNRNKKIRLSHDNAPTHTSQIARAANQYEFENYFTRPTV